MVADVRKLKSHPDKTLFEHVNNVIANVKKLTNLKTAELAAMFHDLGKINPNFQKKLNGVKVEGYAHHGYLSAYAFFIAFATIPENAEILRKWFKFIHTKNDIIALATIIAKHHGNIPDFTPKDTDGSGAYILNKEENNALFQFLNDSIDSLPIEEFSRNYFPELYLLKSLLLDERVQKGYVEKLVFDYQKNKNPLDFYQNTQFAFASLIQADKVDAAKFDNFIDTGLKNVCRFCINYPLSLELYLQKLKQNSELNKLRTKIRKDAVSNIIVGLQKDKNIFELTAPTGSGKTLMMLSLASEIIKQKGAKRIIYALPFLSITEQVEAEVLKIFENQKEFIQRIDSKSQNQTFTDLQNEFEKNPKKEILEKINLLEFSENSFAYPFVITTFVRFFETLLSNKNSDLIKLPNFANSIFLIDEVQALPPRLYTFFTAYLSRFCEQNNSYAIISTATQPNFNLPDKDEIKSFFNNYTKPYELLPLGYFNEELFNRYIVKIDKNGINNEELAQKVIEHDQAVLVILNTIADTKELYELIKNKGVSSDVFLLNTHITPRHRKLKIYLAKRKLLENKKVILISTQLIEAGVDIDFPILYRDMAIVSSIVQSAGRCNRNGKLSKKGVVNLIRLKNNGQFRANLIYGKKDGDLLRFTTQAIISESYEEKELLGVQKSFFYRIQQDLKFAVHSQSNIPNGINFLDDIKKAMFEKIGKFQLIDKGQFGEEMQYYIPENNFDESFNELNQLSQELEIQYSSGDVDWNLIRQIKNKINTKKRKMSENIIQVRLKRDDIKPIVTNQTNDGFLFELVLTSYSFEYGIDLTGKDIIL